MILRINRQVSKNKKDEGVSEHIYITHPHLLFFRAIITILYTFVSSILLNLLEFGFFIV